ncbi:MAG TPA: NUDIX domain-containing protein [Mycobacteriales bacterium]|jgi:predicted NUDIX family NTP pyrophosphohydrolase|nr:NUDIX domain-containing protein [Mycobacteriales bacterium]
MTSRRSAGLLLYRTGAGGVEVLLGHMGGPFWARRDAGAWSIPKGEYGDGEEPFDVARREFAEELGHPVPAEHVTPLGDVRQSGGKQVRIWAAEGAFDPATAVSNTFTLEWPRGSGVLREYPEVDRVAWFGVEEARTRLVRGQVAFLDRLLDALG